MKDQKIDMTRVNKFREYLYKSNMPKITMNIMFKDAEKRMEKRDGKSRI